MNTFVLNQLTVEVVSGFYVFSSFVGYKVACKSELHLIVTIQENRRVHRHQAEECEQALQINCFLCSQSIRNRATHPCFFDAPEPTLPESLFLKQKLEVDLRSSSSVAQSESEKPKISIFSEQFIHKR